MGFTWISRLARLTILKIVEFTVYNELNTWGKIQKKRMNLTSDFTLFSNRTGSWRRVFFVGDVFVDG